MSLLMGYVIGIIIVGVPENVCIVYPNSGAFNQLE